MNQNAPYYKDFFPVKPRPFRNKRVFDYPAASLRRKEAISKYDTENYSSQGRRGLIALNRFNYWLLFPQENFDEQWYLYPC
jgi:hypothetical protein